MQRRAAAVYFVLFLAVGAGAFAFMQVGMSKPDVSLDGPEYGEGDEFDIGDRTYEVATLEAQVEEGGGHGGGASISRTGTLEYFNESARTTATIENGSEITYDGQPAEPVFRNTSDGYVFEVVLSQNVSEILAADDEVRDQTVLQNDTEHVVYKTDGSLVPLDEYLPEPETTGPFAPGDDYEYTKDDGNTTATTVDSVTEAKAVVSWEEPATREVEIDDASNVTLNGVTHIVHFEDNETAQILPADQYYAEYDEQVESQHYYEERKNGFWGIVILSFLGAIVLLSGAYMPVKE